MMCVQSFTPRSNTDWLPRGIPASARRAQACFDSGGHFVRMIEVGVQPDRVVFLEHVHQFRCDALRQHDRGARADADDLHVGNGTQTADDIFEFFVAHQQGVAAREQHVAYLRCTGDVVDAVVDLFLGVAQSCWPAKRRRVQWRQYIEHMSVIRNSTRSG